MHKINYICILKLTKKYEEYKKSDSDVGSLDVLRLHING